MLCTEKVTSKELLAKNLAYFSMVCRVLLKHPRKLDKWSAKVKVAGLEIYLQQMNSI